MRKCLGTSRWLYKHCFHLMVEVHKGRRPLQLIPRPGHLWRKGKHKECSYQKCFILYIIEYAHSQWQVLRICSRKEFNGKQVWFKHAYVGNILPLSLAMCVDKVQEISLEVRSLTSGSVHDPLDVKKERSEPHLHQQLVAVVQADAKGKVALQHSLLWTL